MTTDTNNIMEQLENTTKRLQVIFDSYKNMQRMRLKHMNYDFCKYIDNLTTKRLHIKQCIKTVNSIKSDFHKFASLLKKSKLIINNIMKVANFNLENSTIKKYIDSEDLNILLKYQTKYKLCENILFTKNENINNEVYINALKLVYNSEIECPICYETKSIEKFHILLPCNHLFCKMCFEQFQNHETFNLNKKCPYCNQIILCYTLNYRKRGDVIIIMPNYYI